VTTLGYKQLEARPQFQALHIRRAIPALLSFSIDWAFIGFSLFLVSQNFLFLPIALVIIGSKQRALSNLVHDASHGNLMDHLPSNDFYANCFAAYPMFETAQNYRKSHLEHHRHLGKRGLDPDSDSHFRYGYDDASPELKEPVRLYTRLLFNSSAWKDSFFGQFPNLKAYEKLQVVLWWGIVLAVLTFCFAGNGSLLFAFIWILARATTFHAIRVFAEFLDHTSLPLGSSLSFTRNLPHRGVLAALFHPHEDTFHLVHHLFPKIPHHQLRKAHELLKSNTQYKKAHHCDSYFWGEHSAISCWVGQCSSGGAV